MTDIKTSNCFRLLFFPKNLLYINKKAKTMMLAFNRYENIFLAAAVNLKICAMLQKASYMQGAVYGRYFIHA